MDSSERDCRNRRYRESRTKRSNRYSDESDKDRERSRDRERERDRDRDRDRERDDRDRNYDWHERRRWTKEEWRDSKEKERKWDFKEEEGREYSKEARDYKEYSPDNIKSYNYKDNKNQVKKDFDDTWEKKYDEEDSSDSYGSTEPPKNTTYNSTEARINLEGDIYKHQTPNNTLMIRGLAQHITESDIRHDILLCGLMPKDIRLIRKKDTGASRGFAFVEFNTIQEASRWMDMKKGVLMLQDQFRAILHYSIPKENYIERSNVKPIHDWYCVKCGGHNFKRRDSCFKCHASRQVSEEGGEGSDEICLHPTRVLLMRSLDILTTEDSVKNTLSNYTTIVPKSIRIGQDPLTNTSRGICYFEFNSVLDAMTLTNAIAEKPLVVDGRKLLVSYCKTECPTPQWKQLPNGELGNRFTAEDIPRLSEYCASLYATTIPQLQSYQQYYETYFQTQLAQGGVITLPTQQGESMDIDFEKNSRNPAAASLAQTAIQQAQSAKEASESHLYKKNNNAHMKFNSPTNNYTPTKNIVPPSNPTVSYPVQPTGLPDVSTYQYDESSGYYYDAETGLYYDPNSQYYYNSQTQQFLYWDAEKQSYIPANSEMSNNNKDDNKKGKDKPERHDKVKVAKKIAKDMEKWAKTLNQKKDNARMNITQSAISQGMPKSLGAADAGYAVLERKESQTSMNYSNLGSIDNESTTTSNTSPHQSTASSSLVAAYGGGSESEEDIEDVLQEDKQHTNWVKLACLLCKRQFPSKESLIRHQQLSGLHNQNLEEWYKARGLDPHDPQERNKKYRDRAKERRQKFGEANPTHPNRLKEKYLKAKEDAVSSSYEVPTKMGIGSDNIGNKLLQKMGWQEGMGLGKSNQGRTTIIQAKQKVNTAGLGVKGGCYEPLPGETYKDCVKKMMFARYHELTEQEQGLPNS